MLRELFTVSARAALEWALASLLLANGAAFCLISAAAARLRLGPPCILCARVHRLLCSSSSASAGEGRERDALSLLLCDAHLAAVAAETRAEPDRCDRAAGTGGLTEADDPDQVSAGDQFGYEFEQGFEEQVQQQQFVEEDAVVSVEEPAEFLEDLSYF